jgi:hypothetical protein
MTSRAQILKRHGVLRVSMKRYRPGPGPTPEFTVTGYSVQVDVKDLKLGRPASSPPNAAAGNIACQTSAERVYELTISAPTLQAMA